MNDRELDQIVRGWFSRRALRELFQNQKGDTAQSAIDWMAADGKRLRPLLAAGVFRALKPAATLEAFRSVAVAAECFHKASLVHDDIEDGDSTRYGRPTVHAQQGVPIAINVGDWLLGMGYSLIAESSFSVSQRVRFAEVISQTHLELASGQGDELAFCAHPRALTVDEALGIYMRKTAAAFVCAAQCGAIAAGLDRRRQDLLATCMFASGIAFQLCDDARDAHSEKGREADLLALRPTVALACACESKTPAVRRALKAAWTGGRRERRALMKALAASEVPERVRLLREDFLNVATRSAAGLPPALRDYVLHMIAQISR